MTHQHRAPVVSSIALLALAAGVAGNPVAAAGRSGGPDPAPAGMAQSQEPIVARTPVVVTQGEAILRRAPDQAYVEFAVETRARDPKTAAATNARQMEAVQQRLKSLNLPADAIQTRAYELHEDFDFADGKRVSRGFLARNRIEVRADQLERVGEIIDAGIAAGATNVGAIRFDLKDREAAERDALKRAVADARGRAEAAAAGAGLAIARILRIEEGTVGRPPIPLMRMTAQAEMAQADTPIAPGEIEIRATVTLTVEVK